MVTGVIDLLGRFFVVLGLGGLLALSAQAATPSHLSAFPAPERVVAEIKGTTQRDTQARQVGALRQLWHMVASLAAGRPETADESRLRQSYNVAMGAIDRPVMASFDAAETARLGAQSPRARWVALCSLYEHDQGLRDELLSRFFSPDFRRRFARAIADGHRVQLHSAAELAQNDPKAAPQWLIDAPWYKGPAYALAGVTVVSALWWLWGIVGELGRFSIYNPDTRALRVGRRRYRLSAVTGIVVASSEGYLGHSSKQKYIDPNSLVPTQPQERSVVTGLFHHFKIGRPDGTHSIVALKHHLAKIEKGQRASAVEFRRGKKDYGEYLLFVNHDSSVRSSGALRPLFRPRYTLVASSLLLLACTALYAQAFTDYPANRANFPTWFDFTGSIANRFLDFLAGWILRYPWQLLAGVAAVVIAFQLVGAIRATLFVRRGANALVAELDAEARAQKAAGFDVEAAVRMHGTSAI